MNNEINLNDGFFDLKINEQLPHFRRVHNKEYELIRETKCLLGTAQHGFVGQTVTEDKRYIATAIVYLNKLFQSAVILFERGLPESGNAIIRICFELSIKIAEFTNNKHFVDDLKKENESENKSTLNIIKDKKLFHIMPKEKVEALLAAPHFPKKNFKIHIAQLAERNKLSDAYLMYRLHCKDSHCSITALDEIQSFEHNGVRLNGGLRLEKFSESIYMLISSVLIPFPALIEMFTEYFKLKEQYETLCEKLEKLSEEDSA